MYAALIGDVVSSREHEDRSGLQRSLQHELEALNRRLEPPAGRSAGLAAPLVILRGDEIQGLLHDPGTAVDIAVRLRESLHPTRICWGLGFGPLSTGLAGSPLQMDGPCFHHARDALQRSREFQGWLAAAGFSPTTDDTVTAIFGLLEAVRRRWTARQNEIVRLARSDRHPTQKDAARALGVSPSVISESLKAAAFTRVAAGEAAAKRLLRHFASEADSASDSADRPNSGGEETGS